MGLEIIGFEPMMVFYSISDFKSDTLNLSVISLKNDNIRT